jgi:hypothetical protein
MKRGLAHDALSCRGKRVSAPSPRSSRTPSLAQAVDNLPYRGYLHEGTEFAVLLFGSDTIPRTVLALWHNQDSPLSIALPAGSKTKVGLLGQVSTFGGNDVGSVGPSPIYIVLNVQASTVESTLGQYYHGSGSKPPASLFNPSVWTE